MVGTYGNWEDGVGNLILNQAVHIPGYYAPSAVGLPKTSIALRNTSGNPVAIDSAIIIRSGNRDMGGFFYGDGSIDPFEVYAPAGSYNLAATNRAAKLEVYQPGINIVSTGNPGTVTLDASALPQDTFTFGLDGLSDLTVWIYTPEYYGAYMQLSGSGAVTFAAPAGTFIPEVESEILKTDGSDLTWHYSMLLDENTFILGGNDHPYQVGGAFSVAPYVEGAPLRLDEGEGSIRPGITDAHGNELSRLLYEGYASGGAGQTSLQDRQEFIHSLENSNNQDGVTLKRSLDMQSELISQDWVWETVIPEYTLTNAALGNVQTFPASQYSLYYGNYFYLNSSDPVGTWTAGETVNLGPNGGVKKWHEHI